MQISHIIPRSLLLLALAGFTVYALAPLYATASDPSIDAWWPTQGAHMQGMQPFKAMIPNLDVSQYDMFWQVDGGQLNPMSDNYQDYQHKEAEVDLSQWTWHGSGPYVVNFVAQQGGVTVAQQQETIYVDNGLPASQPASAPVSVVTTPVAVDSSASAATSTTTSSTSAVGVTSTPLTITPSIPATQNAGVEFYVAPNSDAAAQATLWASSNPAGAAAMQALAAQPTAVWFGNWSGNVQNDVHSTVAAAQAQGSVPVLVAYNIPQRDCGGLSQGGSNSPGGYASWIQSFAGGIGSAKAVVILEPDALADISCLSSADQATRLQMLSNAVVTLKNNPNTQVYIDAGHANWIDADTMARELKAANVSAADGFSLNVSNFDMTTNEIAYGQNVSEQTGGKHFVIDTSRNGNGSSNGQWCNPSNMAVGQKPTSQTGNGLIDAFLWVKVPGESDGTCGGGPSAGTWWPSYALELVQNSHNFN